MSRQLFSLMSALLPCLAFQPLAAQEVRWEVPGAAIAVDFTSPKSTAKTMFLPDGFALELPVEFPMLRESVTIVAKHPERGTISLVALNQDAQVESKTESAKDGETRIRVTAKMTTMDRKGAADRAKSQVDKLLEPHRKQAQADAKDPEEMRQYLRQRMIQSPGDADSLRAKFIDVRAAELAKDDVIRELEKIAADKPRWFTKEQQEWRKVGPVQLVAGYLKLVQLRVAEDHLHQCGLDLNTDTRNFEALISSKFDGVYALMSGTGNSSDEARKAIQTLTPAELSALRKALTVSLLCRFYALTKPEDANSQWYNGDRLACKGRGASMIRVTGELDPSHGDASDWWTLEGYDDTKVQLRFPDSQGPAHQLLPDGAQRMRLRVYSAAPESIRYSFELTPREPIADGKTIELHESSALVDAKFPF